MRRTKQIGVRIYAEEWKRLCDVQENISGISRGQKPDISEIVRSLIGWGNRMLLSEAEKAYLAGDINSLGDTVIAHQKKDEHKRRIN